MAWLSSVKRSCAGRREAGGVEPALPRGVLGMPPAPREGDARDLREVGGPLHAEERVRDHGEAIREEHLGGRAGIWPATVAHGEVDAVAIDDVVRGVEREVDVGMRARERGHARDEPARRERRRRGDRHLRAAREARDLREDLRERIEAMAEHRVEAGAGLREHDLPRAALEEGEPGVVLEAPDLVADGGGRDRELRGGELEAPMTSRGLEGAKGGERRQGPIHEQSSSLG